MSPDDDLAREARGPIAYMARNGVAANLLMFFIVAGGLVSMNGLVQEAFPVLSFEYIEVSVSYPGATPDEVEESIVLKIEEQVAALDGVREVSAVATQGHASIMAGLKSGTDIGRALDDIESAVGSIETLPARAARPDVRQMTNRQSVIRLVLYGDVPERTLKELAYRTEDEIAALPGVSYVETSGVRRYEISIEVPLQRLRALGLTLEDVSDAVRRASLDLSAGSIETRDAEVRVRTTGRRYDQHDFEEIIVLSRSDGTVVRVGDLADVRDGFQDVGLITRYQGRRAAFVEVYRAAGEQVLDVAAAVEEHLEQQVAPSLPAGVAADIWNNDAEVYEGRLALLLENGFLGLLLVLAALALFLEIRLALWVATGIGISFVGALGAALAFDVSINTISLFAFILGVGIVVDDAIVVAEHVHAERQKGTPGVEAAIRGARRIQRPVIFAVLTTVAAFCPLLFLPGADVHPGLTHAFGGEQQQQIESFDSLGRSFVLALLAIYALLAIPFGSYTKPLIVMAVIPFGIIGAILGHLIMGLSLSITSMWGIIGLTGVVVNDSLVMIDFINERLRQGAPARTAIIYGAKVRFRPIFLTSLTTFLGFAPLIFERSVQAQFLAPLGVSVGFRNRLRDRHSDAGRTCPGHRVLPRDDVAGGVKHIHGERESRRRGRRRRGALTGRGG